MKGQIQKDEFYIPHIKYEHLQSSLHGIWGRGEPQDPSAATQQHLYVLQ